MSEELLLPQVPEPKPEDPEDVSWALSTAEAMWARGDHGEGIKWVRRAAEAASEAEQDERALELAKAAAELAGLISRQGSAVSIEIDDIVPISEGEPPPVPVKPGIPKPGMTTSKAPAAPKPLGKPGAVSPSRPPAPLPSRTSQPPPPTRASQAPRAGKPLGTNTAKPANMKPPTSKRSRRSRENLEAEARAAAAMADTSPQPAVDPKAVGQVLPSDTTETAAISVPHIPRIDPTQVSHVNDIVKAGGSASEWDATPTQNLTGEDLPPIVQKPSLQGLTRSATAKVPVGGGPLTSKPLGTSSPPATVAGPVNRTPAEKHDPAIVTTQAVRVVVWRDGSGVHVAPAGTVVSAISIDAVLVALEPNSDLTAWLSRRG